jgi:DNA-binding MarR family transcriptional regulator
MQEVGENCLCFHMQRAARSLTRRFDEAFKPLGVSSGQFALLVCLNRPDPPNVGAVATLLAMDRTTLTANLKPLERRGLVKIVADKSDRRSRKLVLTAAGRHLLARAVPIWRRTNAEIERILPKLQLDDLRKSIRSLIDE